MDTDSPEISGTFNTEPDTKIVDNMLNNYIVTFGQIHTHRVNNYTFDKDSVAVIKAKDYGEGRKIAFELFNAKFGTMYEEEDFDRKGDVKFFPRGKHPANF